MENSMTVFLGFRCTPEMKRKLEAIAEQSVAKNVSDHIRFAVEEYIKAHDEPVPEPQPAQSTN